MIPALSHSLFPPHSSQPVSELSGMKDVVIKDLALSSVLDLCTVLCYAEKMKPDSYKTVLGDPQKDIEHILNDLEFV